MEKVLINQFHDILPGSAIHEVYEVTKEEYAALQKEIKALEEERLHALVGDGEGITIFNTTGHDRSDIVELGEIHAEALKDAEGVLYPVQKTAEGAVVYVEHLPSKDIRHLLLYPGKQSRKRHLSLWVTIRLRHRFIRFIWMRRDVLTASTTRKTTGKYCRMAKRQSVPYVRG